MVTVQPPLFEMYVIVFKPLGHRTLASMALNVRDCLQTACNRTLGFFTPLNVRDVFKPLGQRTFASMTINVRDVFKPLGHRTLASMALNTRDVYKPLGQRTLASMALNVRDVFKPLGQHTLASMALNVRDVFKPLATVLYIVSTALKCTWCVQTAWPTYFSLHCIKCA